MERALYFIGICPTHRILNDIHGLKQWVNQKYNSKGALRSNAHITLQMPFRLGQKKESQFLSELDGLCQKQNPFEIALNGFGSFEPRVVFIDVVDNHTLTSLQKELEFFMKKYQVFNGTHKNNGFHPHITIAFRDLKKASFYQLWDEVKNRPFQETFTAESIAVFKHNGKDWDVFKELPLGLKAVDLKK